ncbi:hypothetical protein TNCV_2734931 [Trichonephila clavipes]|nr:hypothetical protein TNCV_2734931 [Trichonephila clavipes]
MEPKPTLICRRMVAGEFQDGRPCFLSNWASIGDQTSLDILNLLHPISSSVEWTPSHVGIEGNEKADFLARTAAEEEIYGDCLALLDNLRLESTKAVVINSTKLPQKAEIVHDMKSTSKHARIAKCSTTMAFDNAFWKTMFSSIVSNTNAAVMVPQIKVGFEFLHAVHGTEGVYEAGINTPVAVDQRAANCLKETIRSFTTMRTRCLS